MERELANGYNPPNVADRPCYNQGEGAFVYDGIVKRKNRKEIILFFIVMIVFLGGAVFYKVFFTPKNSLELYQSISFADDAEEVQALFLEGYEENVDSKDLEYIMKTDTSANRISQFTLIEYEDTSYLIMTTLGTEKLQILSMQELPEEIREYFLEAFN